MARIVQQHAPCLRCGYQLRGLPEDGVCPECGAPVERALRGDLLHFADATYVKRLLLGAQLVFVGLLVAIFSPCLSIPLNAMSSSGRAGLAVGDLLGFAISVLLYVGWWLLTTPNPAVQERVVRDVRSRVILRVALAIEAASFAGSFFGRMAAPSVVTADLLSVLYAVSTVAWVVHLIAGLYYLAGVSHRLVATGLTRSIVSLRGVVWATLAVLVTGLLGGAVLAAVVSPAAAGIVVIVGSAVVGLLLLIIAIWYIVIVGAVAGRLSRVAQIISMENGRQPFPPADVEQRKIPESPGAP